MTDTITWTHREQDWTTEFANGYRRAVIWLKTGPAKSEAAEIDGIHKLRQQDADASEATWFLDAAKLPSFVAHCGEYVNVFDGPAYQAECIRDGGVEFEAMNLPERAIAWPGIAPWFEGFELAVAQVLDD